MTYKQIVWGYKVWDPEFDAAWDLSKLACCEITFVKAAVFHEHLGLDVAI